MPVLQGDMSEPKMCQMSLRDKCRAPLCWVQSPLLSSGPGGLRREAREERSPPTAVSIGLREYHSPLAGQFLNLDLRVTLF